MIQHMTQGHSYSNHITWRLTNLSMRSISGLYDLIYAHAFHTLSSTVAFTHASHITFYSTHIIITVWLLISLASASLLSLVEYLPSSLTEQLPVQTYPPRLVVQFILYTSYLLSYHLQYFTYIFHTTWIFILSAHHIQFNCYFVIRLFYN